MQVVRGRGRPPTHGYYGTPTYKSWLAMLSRVKGFIRGRHVKAYGAVTVCIPWLDFESFLADMGERPPGTTLDRKDGCLGYSKENCRWATLSEQSLNRTNKGGRKQRK